MKSYTIEAIILKSKNFFEADKIITVFSRQFGKLILLAKGARRVTSRKGPNLEVFNKVTLFINSGKSLDTINEATILEMYQGARANLKLVGFAYNICELVDKLTPERQESESIYNLLETTFVKLSKPIREKNLILDFKQKLLEELGYLEKGKKPSMDIDQFIESITEREVKSRKFLLKI